MSTGGGELMARRFDMSASSNAMDFLAGYRRYKKRMGASTDPLLARSGQSVHGALADALRTNTRKGSKRQGQAYLPVTVGNTRYHVYYSNGKRTVIRAGGRRTTGSDAIGTGL